MQRTFKGAIFTLGGIFLMASVLFGVLVVTPEDTIVYNFATSVMVMGLCTSPLIMLVAIVSGISMIVDRFRSTGKRKRSYSDVNFVESDAVLDDIMNRLTPAQQDYLERRLQNKRLGVGNDGELVSMNDLLSEFDAYDEQENRL